MSFREHPLLLRQSFIKLWPNNIFLDEKNPQRLHFLSFYQAKILLRNVLHHRYTKLVATRTEESGIDFDEYLNLYKYQKNQRRKKKRLLRGRRKVVQRRQKSWLEERAVIRNPDEQFFLTQRFLKNNLYQELLHELIEVGTKLFNFLPRIREPIRRLDLLTSENIKWFQRYAGGSDKEKHFRNTVNQIILLHYYKSTPLFADHFGRELEKVHKKVHWRFIHSVRNLLLTVPAHPTIQRQFYGLLIEIKGRPRGRARTFTFRLHEGSLAPQSYFFRISFGMGTAVAKVGVMGLKVWITY